MYKILDTGCFSYPAPNKEHTEDALLLPTYNNNDIIFAIADGVGSSNGANQASEQAIKAVSDTLKQEFFTIQNCFDRAKSYINILSENKELKDTATTLTVMQVTDSNLIIGHIGDCRAYYKKDNKLIKITKDHTRYQQLLDSGEHSIQKLRSHKSRLTSVLTHALSYNADADYDMTILPLSEIIDLNKITLILMSDGAYHHWDKRPKFSNATMSSPSAFSNSLRKRIQKDASDDYTFIGVTLQVK
ncbi:phosphatase 2C family protein [Photobacterium phosphoreum]|uniref:Phosphatase 2C family protein n=1 Tax=Photobacterium phosphoreum TaxID=659 RepID=A0AAW4ZXQ7_PHOPO|nr:protein phosphatase 2C domain-containing protein [Photobacterium phosphoreum]MCD9491726.1 phosphatase 2C family protein [Photobacterium phosphoreum]MCF2191099.1 phosphatase 2C family protein [Photobacterium phosphoreum]MCF2302635.1 phosphatase 2C family protein [Photobacterium phosphoreum]